MVSHSGLNSKCFSDISQTIIPFQKISPIKRLNEGIEYFYFLLRDGEYLEKVTLRRGFV